MNWNIFKYQMNLLREYRFRIEDLETLREDTFYIYYGVHGISYDRIPSTHSPDWEIEKRDKFNEKIERIDLEIDGFKKAIEDYEDTLHRLPEDIQQMVRRKFLDGVTYYRLGQEFGYTPTGVMKHIQKEVEKL